MTAAPLMPRPVKVRDLGAGSPEIEITATDAELLAIAAAFDIPEVKRLSARLYVGEIAKGAFELTGTVHAEIVQACVVTTEPVAQVIDEPVELRFVPEGSAAARAAARSDLDPEAADPPEVYDGVMIDLGSIAVEHFALAVDPYPRAPGVEFPQEGVGDAADAADSPFSALAGLKGGRERGE